MIGKVLRGERPAGLIWYLYGHFVAVTVGRLRAEGLRVALAAPTNDQVQSLVQRVKQLNPDLAVAFVHGHGRDLPPHIAALPGVTQPSAADARQQQDPLVIATIVKLADAFLRNGFGRVASNRTVLVGAGNRVTRT